MLRSWIAAVFVSMVCCSPAFAQQTITIRGDSLTGFVLPIEPLTGDIEIQALRAAAWSVDDTRRLTLEGDVRVSIVGQVFSANRAVVWINRIPSRDGVINQIAVYFDRLVDPTKRAGTGVAGQDLLITGSTRGEVTLDIALLVPERPRRTRLLERAEERLALHLRRIVGEQQQLHRRPQAHRPDEPERFVPVPGGTFEPEQIDLPDRIVLPEQPDPTPWLGAPTGSIRYAAQEVEIVSGDVENVTTLIGPLVIEYVDLDATSRWERLTLTAERGVIFSDPAPLEELADGALNAESIRGIYLEGNVIARANVDEYVVRSPHVFYDFRADRAVMLDAVLRTYSRQQNVLIYARAREMRQIAENQWQAQQVRVSTSEFFTPHFALGANQMTITQRPDEVTVATVTDPGPRETHLDTRNLTLRLQDMPFFYWPRFSATLGDTPLRGVNLGSRDEDGVRVLTSWNLFGLMGTEAPDGVDAELKLDGFTKRGAAVGLDVLYDVGRHVGRLDLYGLYDEGTDRTSSGLNVEPERETRGVALWQHHTRLSPDWTAQAQVSFISDPTFISAWREDDFRERREYETSLYLKGQSDNNAFTTLVKYELNDFISNDYLLASRQYKVDTFPEITYRRYGDSLGEIFTYSTENRLSRVRLVMQDTTPREIGVRGAAFGLGNDDEIDLALQARGLPTYFVNRADSRHELSMPRTWGIVRVVPFAVGRITAYDETFDELSDDADNVRLFGAAGVTLSTRFQRVDNSVESRIFDLHRMRHVIEPRVSVWYGYSTVPQDELPVFDEEVEGIAGGTVVQFGVRNTLQTQRGGPGRWRSVDFLTIDTALVLNSNDADRRSPTPQFFDYRPEHSQFGDHVRAAMVWLLSDNLSLVGEGTYDLDESAFARGAIGAQMIHSPVLNTFVEYRYIEASDNELLDIGWNYQLTPKYFVQLRPQWDLREDDFRAIRARVTRTFPDFDLVVQVRYDRIRDDITFGASLGLVRF